MNERLQKMMHFLAGVLVILHGLEDFESGYGSTLFYLILGLAMLTMAFFQNGMEKKNPKLSGLIYWMEAIIIFFIAFEKFEEFKKFLPMVYIGIGILYFISGYSMMMKKIKIKKR